MYLKKLWSVHLSTLIKQGQEFDVDNAVKCMQAFINNGKLRSASFTISTDDTDFEDVKLWRQKLLQHPEVKKWSKVIRVRCEVYLAK